MGAQVGGTATRRAPFAQAPDKCEVFLDVCVCWWPHVTSSHCKCDANDTPRSWVEPQFVSGMFLDAISYRIPPAEFHVLCQTWPPLCPHVCVSAVTPSRWDRAGQTRPGRGYEAKGRMREEGNGASECMSTGRDQSAGRPLPAQSCDWSVW